MSDDTLSHNSQLALADARLKVLNREPFTREEYRALMLHLREDRENAARAAAANTRAAKKIMAGSASRSGPVPKLSLGELFPGSASRSEVPGMNATGVKQNGSNDTTT